MLTLSQAISATSDSPSGSPADFATSGSTAVSGNVRQVLAGTVLSSTVFPTDTPARAASGYVEKDVPSVQVSAALSRAAVDAVFASHRSALDQTVLPADSEASAFPGHGWRPGFLDSWDQNKTADSSVTTLDKVLARFGV